MDQRRRDLNPLENGLSHNPFSKLSIKKTDSETPEPSTCADSSDSDGDSEIVRGRRLTLSKRRKGQAGKPALILTGLGAGPAEHKALAREMASALGRGVRVAEDGLVLQGLDAERPAAWLTQRGAAEVRCY